MLESVANNIGAVAGMAAATALIVVIFKYATPGKKGDGQSGQSLTDIYKKLADIQQYAQLLESNHMEHLKADIQRLDVKFDSFDEKLSDYNSRLVRIETLHESELRRIGRGR